jgi:ribonuclease VapC
MSVPALDAHALLAYLEREAGFAKVKDHFAQALSEGNLLPMTTVNVGEVLYIVRREQGADNAAKIESVIHSLPIALTDVDLELAREAARFKADGGLSYADCFAAALASLHQIPLLTGDPEFKVVEGKIAIEWL